jgi:hypothetical protein
MPLPGREPMDDQKYQILLLARPGYHRNGIEATLLTIDNINIQTTGTCESAFQFLSNNKPALLIIYPRRLDEQLICNLCNRFFDNEKNRVLLLAEPYGEKFDLSAFCGYQVFEIETSDQLKHLILEKLGQEEIQEGGEK